MQTEYDGHAEIFRKTDILQLSLRMTHGIVTELTQLHVSSQGA